MKSRTYFLFFFFTMLFLFYPGDSEYFRLYAYNRKLFATISEEQLKDITINPIPQVRFQSYPTLTSYAAYVVDLPSFTPLIDFNSKTKLFPASTVKVITALVAMDIYKTDDVITVKRALDEGQVMGLQQGERITVENLLYGILVHSGNDAAYALADAYGFDKFIVLMNKKAQALGMRDSHFTNPAGLDDAPQHITAFDLALASRALLMNNFLRKVVATKEITISDVDYQIFHKLSNVNVLLGEIQGIGGLKTGYTEFAGENLVSFYKKNGHQYIIVVLKSKDRFEDTRSVVKWIDENVSFTDVN